MRTNAVFLSFVSLFVAVAAFAFVSSPSTVEFSSLEEQVDYCEWKYEKYCEDWEYDYDFRPGRAPMGGFRNYAPECYQNGLELNDGLEVCLAYEYHEE